VAAEAGPLMSALLLVCFFLYVILTLIGLFWSER
jgi:hypothetical protein